MAQRVLVLVALGLLASGMAHAQGAEDPKAGRLSVTGTGTVSVTPDVGKVYLSVSVLKPTARAACEQAAVVTGKVRSAVQGTGVGEKDITTENFSVQPQYTYPPEGQPKVTGYTCQQSLVVKVNEVNNTKLAAVIDSAVAAGGNDLQVSQVVMELSPALRKSATDQAREVAVDDAASTAKLLAKAAGVTLGGIKSIADNNVVTPQPIPYAAGGVMAAMPAADASKETTPVQIGDADVMATVSMEYAIAN
ncbi:26 kDa periplasmic immunogenic [Micractinium conductrix]|uniref:26 kDa periplasmic immunogenic n=1 Tax=Micractinium conductrix TaxID=554055 RepID=A0A2P6VCC2_9CHLO|nr:26 kDa periplasmic immunogenic [Micractinium conductrix]|eukprot:PSC71736.1 26 kDa periplasmic immunogenic [Micractinium conductrix]